MKKIRRKAPRALQFLFSAVLTSLALGTASVHGQQPTSPDPFRPPPLPPIAHEAASVSWPVPDYFAQALEITKLKPAGRAAEVKAPSGSGGSPPYLVLPVQTQAFGFAPAFRALAGAYLDEQLEVAGLAASRQTDIADAYGPFVRRLPDALVDRFVAAHPKQSVLGLYLGHDGIDQMFVTLVVHSGTKHRAAHRAAKMENDPLEAARQLRQMFPSLLKSVGLPTQAPRRSLVKPSPCSADTWLLAPPTATSPAQRACHAIAVGSLLPHYGSEGLPEEGSESSSPARLAWLAQAIALADSGHLASASAEGVRVLALKQIGFPSKDDLPEYVALSQVRDPVVSRLSQLKGAFAATEGGPWRSAREARERVLNQAKQGLPAFASAIFETQAAYVDAFSELDTCPIERVLPGLMLRAACQEPHAVSLPRRPAWPAEILLFEEWRLASHYKAVDSAEFTLGSRTRTDKALSQWPRDVAAHPYLQRLHAAVLSRRGLQGSFDEQLLSARSLARLVTQTSVDLQRADRWLAAYSLAGHVWTGNLNVMNDAEVRDISSKEERLLSVLRFDRFTKDRYMAERRAGDPPFFVAPSPWAQMMAGPMAGLTVTTDPPVSAVAVRQAPAASATPYQPPLFSRHIAQMELPSEEHLSKALASNPRDLETRVSLALVRLRDGGKVADAVRLIDAAPDDTRPDHRVAMSHAWGAPAHLFYFAGELNAAQRYYRKVSQIGTGSESDMLARIRLKLLEGQLREALIATAARVQRYNSDFARRDQAALLFMLGQRDQGWSVFLSNAASSQLFQLWVAAYTGHRMEGTDLAAANRWIDSHQLGSTQIKYQNVRSLYLHLLATMDRLPSLQDIALLKKPHASDWTDPRWPASAQLFRSALTGEGFQDAYKTAKSALAGSGGNPSSSVLMPLYAWVAWHATEGKDEALEEMRRATTRWDFDEMLAKSLVLALDGDTAESLKFFNAARYAMAATSAQPYPGPYSFALAGYLMYRKTGVDAYRQQVLSFVEAQQRVFPFYGWLYAMQALLDTDPARRASAACRARHLDRGSFFLSLAEVNDVNEASCQATLTAWLR